MLQRRYHSRQSALATEADVLTLVPHRICFTAISTLKLPLDDTLTDERAIRVRLTFCR